MKKIIITGIILTLMVIFKNQIALFLMDITDLIASVTGANVVSIIDMLNEIYYL